MTGRPLNVGGFTPFTATDYPGLLAGVVFVQGCAWRCGYCHNPHLQARPRHSPLDWREVLDVLERRRGLLDAVVFSGGEPTTDLALPEAMRAVRALGFKVGLHTACLYPDRLRAVLPLVDWVGFDVKAPFDRYEEVTGVPGSGVPARAAVAAIVASGIASECRTTVHPALLAPDTCSRLPASSRRSVYCTGSSSSSAPPGAPTTGCAPPPARNIRRMNCSPRCAAASAT